MNKDSEIIIQIPVLKKLSLRGKRIEFHKNKIIPQKGISIQDDIIHENEWQQEYYIIYNSYVLEEKEPDTQ